MSADTYISDEHLETLKGLLSRDRLTSAVLVLYDTEWTHEGTQEERDTLRAARHILSVRANEYAE